jgi:hypothetical protein
MSTEKIGISDMLTYSYGVVEQIVLDPVQKKLMAREIASIRREFKNGAVNIAALYGYPIRDGNVEIEGSEPRQNMPAYLDSVGQIVEMLGNSKLVLSGFITESRDNEGNFINQNPISEAQAAGNYYGTNSDFELELYSVIAESINENSSKFVEQLHNSLVELRRLGDTNVVVHVRIQDALRVRWVLEELHNQGKISNDIKTMVVSHAWKLDVGDIKGSLAFSLLKLWKLDFPTIKRLDQYQDGNS